MNVASARTPLERQWSRPPQGPKKSPISPQRRHRSTHPSRPYETSHSTPGSVREHSLHFTQSSPRVRIQFPGLYQLRRGKHPSPATPFYSSQHWGIPLRSLLPQHQFQLAERQGNAWIWEMNRLTSEMPRNTCCLSIFLLFTELNFAGKIPFEDPVHSGCY